MGSAIEWAVRCEVSAQAAPASSGTKSRSHGGAVDLDDATGFTVDPDGAAVSRVEPRRSGRCGRLTASAVSRVAPQRSRRSGRAETDVPVVCPLTYASASEKRWTFSAL